MTSNADSVMQTYLAATAEIRKVLVSFTAPRDQKDAAEAALADLTTALAMYSVQQVEGRTALLTALIVELNGVIDKIRVDPIGDVLARFNGLLGAANRLLATEKEAMRAGTAAPAALAVTVAETAAVPRFGAPDVRQLIFSTEAVLSDRMGATIDPSEKVALEAQIAGLVELRALVSDPDDIVQASVAWRLADTLDQAVANLRIRPFDNVLGSLQTLSDQVAGALGDSTRGRRGGRAEVSEDPEQADVAAAEAASLSPPSGRREAGGEEVRLSCSRVFSDLKDEYVELFNHCKVLTEKEAIIKRFYVAPLLDGRRHYESVGEALGVPWWFIGIIHGLECSFNFRSHLHNGDPLNTRTVRHPPGHPRAGSPPFTWRQSALDALRLEKLHRESDWSLPRALFLWEGYNGMGYRTRGLPSPYLWGFSSEYEKGKFVRDGVFDTDAVSQQCGAATLLKHLVEEDIVEIKRRTRNIVADAAPTTRTPSLSSALVVSPLGSTKKELAFPGKLKNGSKDSGAKHGVRSVQEWCCYHNVDTDVDGNFGSGTEGSVKSFQRALGLPPSGVIDERIWLELTAPMRRVLKPIEKNRVETLYDVTLRVARQHLSEHPVEIGKDNCGPWVRLYMGGKQGRDQFWCAGFVCFVVAQAALALGQDQPFKRRVGVDQLVEDAKASGRFVSETHLSTGIQRVNRLRPGCLFVRRRTANDWTHTGIVIEVGPDSFKAIEGNTNDEGVRNGFEVCIRSRGYKNKDFILLA